MKFRKKPVVVDAIQFNDPGLYPILYNFIGEKCGPLQSDDEMKEWRIPIKTLEGTMYLTRGDWIIRGVKGEYYPCKPDIFEMTYEPIEGSTGL